MRGIFEIMTAAGGPVAPISESRERALRQLGYESVTPQVLQRYGITQDQLDAYFKPARDAQSLQRLLESFLDKTFEEGSALAIDMLDSIDNPAVRNKITDELSSLVLYVIRSRGLRVPFPRAIAQGALRSHISKIAPTTPKSDTLSLFVDVPELTDRELEYLRLDRSDISADMDKKGAELAVKRLHGVDRDKISDMGKDEAAVERAVRQELKELGVNDRRQIVFKLLGAIRNAKIKKNKVLDKEDERWLGSTPERVMERANYFMDNVKPVSEEKAPSEVGEVDYGTVSSDAKEFITTLKKLRDYTKSIQQASTGGYDSTHPELQRDIDKIRTFQKPSIPESVTGPLAKEMDRLSKTPVHRKVLEDMIDPYDQVYTDPKDLKEKYQYAEAGLLDRYKKMRDRKPGEPYTLPIPSGERYTPEGRFLRTMTLGYMSRLKSGDALKTLDDMIKDVESRMSAADEFQVMKNRGELDRFEQLSRSFMDTISGELRSVTQATDAQSWEGVIDLMHMLYSQLSTLFYKPDVVAHLKPLWDRGSDWLGRTDREVVDKGFEGVFASRKDFGDVALSRAVKDRDPAIFLGYLDREPLLKYISHKLFMLEREPLKHLRGPSFDQTAKMVASFQQGTSRALSALNPTSLRRRALKGIFDIEDPDVEVGTDSGKKQEDKKAPVVREKKAVWDVLREAAIFLLGGKAEDVALLRKRFKTEKAPDWGHFRKRPSKLFGQVTLSGFFDKPDYVKSFVKALESRSKMLVDAALRPEDPKHLRKADPEAYKKKMGIDGLVAEVLGTEEKNIEDVLIRRRLNTMMDERLEKSSQKFFDRDPDTGKTKARLEKEKVADKIKGIQNKYLPTLNAMAKILNNPFPAIKRSLDSMSSDRRREYEEAIGKLQNLTPEEREKALEIMHSKSEALGLMGKEHRFLSKNVLAPLMEGTLVEKDPVSDEEYNAAAKKFKEIVARRGVKRPKDEEESPASFENFKKELDHSIQMLFSPQAYTHSIIKGINVSKQVEDILSSDPVKYNFNPRDREELMDVLLRRHRDLQQIIDTHNKKMDENLETLRSGEYEDKGERHKLVRSWQLESKALDKLESEVSSVLNMLRKVESEYHTKIKEAPIDKVLDRAKEVIDYKLQAPSITIEDINKTKNPELLAIYLRKIESYRTRLENKKNDIEGYRRRITAINWDKAKWGKIPGESITKNRMIDILLQEERGLQANLNEVKELLKILSARKSQKFEERKSEIPKQIAWFSKAIATAKTIDNVKFIYEEILKYKDEFDKAIRSIGKIHELKKERKDAATVINRPVTPKESPEETPEETFVPGPREESPYYKSESDKYIGVVRKIMKNTFPDNDWSEYSLIDIDNAIREFRTELYSSVFDLVKKQGKIIEDSIKQAEMEISRHKDFTTKDKARGALDSVVKMAKNFQATYGEIQNMRSDIENKKLYDESTQKKVTDVLSSSEKNCREFLGKLVGIRDQLSKMDIFKGLEYKKEPYGTLPKMTPPAPQPTPGIVKTAAIEDVKKSDPETFLREETEAPASFYDEKATHLKEMDLLEYLYEGAGEDLSRFKEISKSEYVKKDAIEKRIKELEQTLKKLGKLQAIEVFVSGRDIPLKEIPYEFDKMSENYFNAMAQARAQMRDTVKRVEEAKKRIGEIEQYYDPETGDYKMTDAEKRSIMDIFYQGLFWAMQNYWNEQLGKGTKGGERDLYFGERTQEPFWKIYETFKALGGVKSNPVYQKLLKTGEAVLKAHIDDTKHRTMKGAYLDEMKKMSKRWVDLGYTEKEIEQAKKRNPYKHFEEQIEYLDSVKKQQNLIFKSIREVSDAKYVNHILGEIAKKTKDDGLRATIEKRQKEILGEVKSDSKKVEDGLVAKEVDVNPEELKKIVMECDNIFSGKYREPQTVDVKKEPKTAYDRSHPDFDLKILYGPVMQRTIVSMLKL